MAIFAYFSHPFVFTAAAEGVPLGILTGGMALNLKTKRKPLSDRQKV